jgi:hypothetical protein
VLWLPCRATVDPSTDTRLANLVTWGVDLEPPFQPDVHHYTVVVAASVEQLKVSAVPVQVRYASPLAAKAHPVCPAARMPVCEHLTRPLRPNDHHEGFSPAAADAWHDDSRAPINPKRRRC